MMTAGQRVQQVENKGTEDRRVAILTKSHGFPFPSVSMALRHWGCVLIVYSGVCSSCVDVLKVSIGFNVFLSAFLGGER